MGDKFVTFLGSIIVLATVTTLVLPGRGTANIIKEGGSSLSGVIRAALGMDK